MRIYAHHDRFMVWQIKQLLDDNGVPCYIKNEFAIGAVGELAPMDIQPEVWLTDDGWASRATRLIQQWQAPSEKTSWQCQHCHELNEPSFDICWSCGKDATS